jgi:hypothetical protein
MSRRAHCAFDDSLLALLGLSKAYGLSIMYLQGVKLLDIQAHSSPTCDAVHVV